MIFGLGACGTSDINSGVEQALSGPAQGFSGNPKLLGEWKQRDFATAANTTVTIDTMMLIREGDLQIVRTCDGGNEMATVTGRTIISEVTDHSFKATIESVEFNRIFPTSALPTEYYACEGAIGTGEISYQVSDNQLTLIVDGHGTFFERTRHSVH